MSFMTLLKLITWKQKTMRTDWLQHVYIGQKLQILSCPENDYLSPEQVVVYHITTKYIFVKNKYGTSYKFKKINGRMMPDKDKHTYFYLNKLG